MSPICPLCKAAVSRLVQQFSLENDGELLAAILEQHPEWEPQSGACTHCVDHFHTQLYQGTAVKENHILPTPIRLRADQHYQGKGITICFIDSGFYEHPDLTLPTNRILDIHDITAPHRGREFFKVPHDESWHGTMTSVVAAGNGWLSEGLYSGLAPQANLVLLKVMNEGRIEGKDIAKAIRWAIDNKNRLGIRIINLSVTDDWPLSYLESEVDQAAEAAVAAGIVVVAAVGNDPEAPVKPPANSPSVLAVGGVDDHNTLGDWPPAPYHSTYGITADGLLKPELIAPSIWLAAPILPETPQNHESRWLFNTLQDLDGGFGPLSEESLDKIKFELGIRDADPGAVQSVIKERLAVNKYILPDYLHADGTSFAAPIVCSLVAQMLEANPALTPSMVKAILIGTATTLDHIPVERQGYGLINASAAVKKAAAEKHTTTDFSGPSVLNGKLKFLYHNDEAQSVELVGSFNNWMLGDMPMTKDAQGLWQLEIPSLATGKYLYKFVVDGYKWETDPMQTFRESDGFNGFNSVLKI